MRRLFALTIPLVCIGLVSCSRQDDTTILPENASPVPTSRALSPEQEKIVALLDKPCSEAPENVGNSGYYVECGRDGRNGVVQFPGRVGMPKGALALKGSMGNVIVGIEGRRVWVQHSCPMCRTNVDMTVVADLEHAKDGQLQSLQVRAEMQSEHLMRSPGEWEDAVDDWKPRN